MKQNTANENIRQVRGIIEGTPEKTKKSSLDHRQGQKRTDEFRGL